MKQTLFTSALCICMLFLAGFTQPLHAVDVTFQVDMNEYAGPEDYTALGVTLNGTFNSWCGDCNPMADGDADGVYDLTLDLPAGDIEYKFVIGAWVGQENFTAGVPCTVTNNGFTNRALNIATDPIVLNTVCWESCDVCGAVVPEYPVTFSVDMNEYAGPEDYVATGVFLNGNFNGFCGACAPMDDMDGDGVYDITINLAAGAYEYKYTIGAFVDQEELTPGTDCVVTNFGFTNRFVNVVDMPVVQPEVCWASCVDCGVVVPEYNLTVAIDMAGYMGAEDFAALGVNLNGSFNGFCGDCTPMDDSDGDGVYTVTVPLQDGTYEYKVAIGAWIDQEFLTEGDPCTTTIDGFTNRTVTIAGADVDQGVVCFAECGACVAETLYPVSFAVDMNEYAGPEDYVATGVFLNGTFNNFCGACAQMDDTDGDGVYELMVDLPAAQHEYKFTIGAFVDQENLTPGSACTVTNFGFTNRFVDVVDMAVTQPVVCWGACEACGVAPEEYPVTFSVDMNEYAGPEDYVATGVFLNGTFNGFCGACAPMDDTDGDGVYELTINLPPTQHEYKFTIGAFVDQEELTPGTPCTVTNFGFTNRFVDVVDMAVTQPTVCWAACDACGVVVPEYNLTVSIDMAGYTGTEDFVALGVNLNGSFNGFCGDCTPMDDSDGDGVYTATVPLTDGTYEYKVAIGAWIDQEFLTEGDVCTSTIGGFTNRTVTIAGADVDQGVVCFAQCDACAAVEGCTDDAACNYDAAADTDNGSCAYADEANCIVCFGGAAVDADLNGNGICDFDDVFGCTNSDAINYNASATADDGSCMFDNTNDCPADVDGNNMISIGDLLAVSGQLGSNCP